MFHCLTCSGGSTGRESQDTPQPPELRIRPALFRLLCHLNTSFERLLRLRKKSSHHLYFGKAREKYRARDTILHLFAEVESVFGLCQSFINFTRVGQSGTFQSGTKSKPLR